MRSLFAAALVGLASYGAYALLIHPETTAFLRSVSATSRVADDLARPAPEAEGGPERGDPAVVAAAGGVETSGPSSGVNASVETDTYQIEGDTERELLASLRAQGPTSEGSVYFGLTVTELEYRYYKVTEQGACRIEDVEVDLLVRITLPEWRPPPGADAELRSAWARFSTALRGHENGHRDRAVDGAEAVRAAIEGLRTTSCDVADRDAQQAAERVRVETEAAHRDFDHHTGHGRTQGAVWPQP